jgi:DNA polymerase-3 subunit delta
MSFQSFLDQARRKFPSSVYLFFASDPFLCREALEVVREIVPVSERDFNLHVFDLSSQGEESSPFEQILNVVNTASFFGGKRFTVVTGNLQKIVKKDTEKLRSYVMGPAPDSVLVLFHHGLLGKEARDKFKPLKPVCIDIRESEIPNWIRQKLQEMGVDISDEAIEYVISLVGVDLGLLSAEIGKISCIGQKRIDVHDIADIVAGGRQYGAFDLVDALKARDAQKVFRVYRSLQLTSDDYGLIGALNWQYARFPHQSMSREESRYLCSAFELLHQADIEIKSSGRNYPMEYLLIKLLKLQRLRSPSG